MKGFIEVTDYDGGMKVLLPVSKITAIICDDGGSVFVETGFNKEGESSGVLVTESYEEIKQKIRQNGAQHKWRLCKRQETEKAEIFGGRTESLLAWRRVSCRAKFRYAKRRVMQPHDGKRTELFRERANEGGRFIRKICSRSRFGKNRS